MAEDGESASWLDALWERTLEAWDDDATHAALLDDATKGTRAKAQIDAIVLAATSLLFSKKTPAPGKTPWPITLSAVGVCLLLFSWLAWELFPHP